MGWPRCPWRPTMPSPRRWGTRAPRTTRGRQGTSVAGRASCLEGTAHRSLERGLRYMTKRCWFLLDRELEATDRAGRRQLEAERHRDRVGAVGAAAEALAQRVLALNRDLPGGVHLPARRGELVPQPRRARSAPRCSGTPTAP